MSANLIAHGIKRLGVLGAGQMGTGIALVSAAKAKVPVLLYDKSPEQVKRGLSLVDKLLDKDINKGRITSDEAKDIRGRIEVVPESLGFKGLRDVDMVVEVRQRFAQEWNGKN
jgi:3-hydroxybutyryl-CoA dehydrogenase